MSGAFYGSLAASASVFVAILTALLVNNYVTLKADRRQLTRRIKQIDRDIDELEEERDKYQETVDEFRKQKEEEYREEAEQNVSEFVNEHLKSDFFHAVENLTVEDLYRELLKFYDYESSNELEDSEAHKHHRDALADRKDDIEKLVLNRTVDEFASRHQGRGQVEDPTEADDKNFAEEEENYLKEVDWGLELEKFVDKFKEEYDVDDLDDRTRDLLEEEYHAVVDIDPDQDAPAFTPSDKTIAEALKTAEEAKTEFEKDFEPAEFPEPTDSAGVSKRRRDYEDARDNLVQTKSEIESLQRTKDDLQQQKEGVHPSDLNPTLYANAVTIFLSVVVPIFVYLIFVTNSQVPVPSCLWIISHTEVNVFLSWLLGLFVVFESIHARINDRDPRAYSLYRRVRNWVQERR